MLEGRTPQDCFEQFRQHIAGLVADVLAPNPPLIVQHGGKARAMMSFPNTAMRLKSRVGDLQFYIGQELEAYERPKSRKLYTLRTCAYWYRIAPWSGPELLRWEYVRDHRPEVANHCRNHLHIHTTVQLPGGELELKKTHLPTGWVTIEGVLRFLFTDLGVVPACTDWPAKLAKSEHAFRTSFSPWGPPQ